MAKETRAKPSKKPSRPKPLGWNTTDEDEIARRIARAENNDLQVQPADSAKSIFSDWTVTGGSGENYHVEIRSGDERINSCNCKDYSVNGLGTCKHIEAVLIRLRKRQRAELKRGHSQVEIFLDRRDMRIKVDFPQTMRPNARVRQVVAGFFDETNTLRGDPLQSMAALRQKLEAETAYIRGQIRISSHLNSWLAQRQQAAEQRAVRRRFEQDLQQGRASLDVVKLPLYPYQQEGMMHLAFTGRALLADEMGLGKTVQAIAGTELLNRLHAIDKVLVISPASLKSEWLEQIEKFSDRPAIIIQGMRKRRHQLYQQESFYYLANYEQILYDKDFINETFQPDLIILDEAQRIKNWQTKTASAIKQLKSAYAFVLTGTPLENRIDEIYSIAQFLDPNLFGPLFRFNREFYKLDERGQAVGYKNLDKLHERLRPIMLRRRKDDVEGELPARSVNNFFVPMSPPQMDQYDEHKQAVARLTSLAKRRPLKKDERDRLMRELSCMRMACDTPFILDQNIHTAPKLDELEKLLEELLSEPQCKIIVFSEWERMLTLLAERLQQAGIGYAWHTGSVTQKKRREEINRFKNDPQCRLFLATDSAATGLNLQIARVVVNLDLPWNPARLEQRIARAWRKHQKHPVSVINLVSEHTIEHRMLTVLRHKTTLADEVVDGVGKIREMEISAGKGSFMSRLDEMLADPKLQPTPIQRFTEDAIASSGDRLERVELRGNTLLAVLDEPSHELAEEMSQRLKTHFGDNPPRLEMLDRATFEALQRLVEAGVIQFSQPTATHVYDANDNESKVAREKLRRESLSNKHLDVATEKRRMSQCLAQGGFTAEALPPLGEAMNHALKAAAILADIKASDPISISEIGSLQSNYQLPADTISVAAMLRHESATLDETGAKDLLQSANALLDAIMSALNTS